MSNMAIRFKMPEPPPVNPFKDTVIDLDASRSRIDRPLSMELIIPFTTYSKAGFDVPLPCKFEYRSTDKLGRVNASVYIYLPKEMDGISLEVTIKERV